jgi:hypothetical protein
MIIVNEREVNKMKNLNVTINFDMDGTIADLYGVPNWLEMLVNHNETPYAIAEPLLRLNILARMLNRLQREGYRLAIISWLSKSGNADYNEKVTNAKLEWLAKHLPSVHWDNINIVEYGTPKENFCETPFDILFDDEEKNRENWNGIAFDVDDIVGILKTL